MPDAESALAVEIRTRLAQLEQQVLAQFTAAAAHHTIAQRDNDALRTETRADLDRTKAHLVGLIDRLRSELHSRLDDIDARLDVLEYRTTQPSPAALSDR